MKEAEKVLEEVSSSVVGAEPSSEEAKVDAMLTLATTGSTTGADAAAAGTVDANTIANRGFTAPPVVDSDEEVQHFDVSVIITLHCTTTMYYCILYTVYY